ncbi:MAG: STAS domain-containing protein [Candidatus Eremiobacteraeota bacterium]|nr:STAS domain-containing protein [Candidatus Eremiobacteraeota bacterium]
MNPIVESKDIAENIHLVSLEGDIDFIVYPELKKQLLKLIESGKINMIVNLDKVNYIDSSGLGAITSAHLKVTSMGGNIKIVSPNSDINKIFDITGLSKVVKIYSDYNTALSSFNAEIKK